MIKIDKEACIGCGSCEAVCPDVFGLNDDMKAYVKPGKEDSKLPCVKEAVDICAVDAIKV